MNKNSIFFAIPGALVISFMVQGFSPRNPEETRRIPLEDFFRNPEQSAYQISPNGKFFSFMAPYQRRMNVFVQEIGGEGILRLTNDTLRDIAGYAWAGNDRILYLNDTGGDENYKLYVVDVDGKNLKALTDFEGVRTTFIDPLVDEPDEVIIGLNKRNAMVFDPYRLNIITGELTMLAENPGNIQGWMTDHDGKLRVAIAIVDGVNQSLLYRDTEDEEFRSVLTVSFKETLSPLLFTFDNKNVYAASNLNRDKAALVEFDISNGKEIKELYENPDYDISNLAHSRKRKIITSASYTSWKRERHFFDKETRKLFDFLYKKLKGYELGITSMSKEEDRMIIRTYKDRSLGAYYLFDKNTKELTKIAELGTWFSEDELASMTPVQYKSRDGLTINGYLTLPAGYSLKTAKNLPVVINPHDVFLLTTSYFHLGAVWELAVQTANSQFQ